MLIKKDLIQVKDDLNKKLKIKLNEIEIIKQNDVDLMNQFYQEINEKNANEYTSLLLKIFKRKIKKSKKSDEYNSSSSSSSSSDTDQSDLSDDNDDIDHQDICPDGCNKELYQIILQLRDQKIKNEEVLFQLSNEMNELDKEYHRYITKLKSIHLEVKKLSNQLEIFQTKKQKELNRIKISIPLALENIHYITKGLGIPSKKVIINHQVNH